MKFRIRKFSQRRRGWALGLVALSTLVLAAVAGHTAYGYGYKLLKPTFNHPSQHIYYHDTFHDGHSHDGYGHGYHGGNSRHVHNSAGNPVSPNDYVIHRFQGPITQETLEAFETVYGGVPAYYTGSDYYNHPSYGPNPVGPDHHHHPYGGVPGVVYPHPGYPVH